jgi:hypothetical protein
MADSEDKTAAALKKVQIFEAVSIIVANGITVSMLQVHKLMSAKACLLFYSIVLLMPPY